MELEKRSKLDQIFNGVFWSILIGVFVFTVSIIVLVSSVDANSHEEKMNVYFSDKTEIYKDVNGDDNNLIIGNEKLYYDYLSSLPDSVFVVNKGSDIILQKFNPDLGKYEFMFDTNKVSSKDKYYFHESKYIFDKIFYSNTQNALITNILKQDSVLEDSLAARGVLLGNLKTSGKVFFNVYPNLLIWIILISMAIGFSFSTLPFLLSEIHNYSGEIKGFEVFKCILGGVFLVILMLVPLFILATDKYDFLIKPLDTTGLLSVGIKKYGLHWNSILPYTGVLFWIILVFLMSAVLQKILKQTINSEQPLSEEIYRLKVFSIKNIEIEFEKQLIVVAIFLAFTIICTDMMLGAFNQIMQLDTEKKIFPTEFSFINGLMQTFFLSMVYIFVSGGINRVKEKMIDFSQNDSISNDALKKNKTFKDYLKLIITVLAPVLGGALQKLIEMMIG